MHSYLHIYIYVYILWSPQLVCAAQTFSMGRRLAADGGFAVRARSHTVVTGVGASSFVTGNPSTVGIPF